MIMFIYVRVIKIGQANDPNTSDELVTCQESHNWLIAMQEELKSKQDNDIWDFVDLPDNSKSIGCKLLYKTKRDSRGHIECFKPRLVAKGFI